MGRVFGNKNEVALADLLGLAAVNRVAREILCVRRRLGLVDKLAAGHQGGRSVNHVEQLGLADVYGGVPDRRPVFHIYAIRRAD